MFQAPPHSRIDKFFGKHKNPQFAADAEVAFRAAAFILFLALPFFLPRTQVKQWNPVVIELMDAGWYGKYAVACFLFSYYKNLGNTVNLAITTIAGTWLAVFGIWILFGVYPEGMTPGESQWRYADCFCYGGLFTWLVLWLNLPLNTQIFALSSFVWYYMAFMDKNVQPKNFAKNFKIDLGGSATKELLNAAGGSLLAVFAMCFPRRVMAVTTAVDDTVSVLSTMVQAWKDLTEFTCAASEEEMNEFEEATIKRALRQISSTVAGIRGNMEVAWWECLGMGGIQRQRIMLDSLEDFVTESYDRMLSLFAISLAEKSPSKMMQEVKPSLHNVILESGLLLGEGFGAIGEMAVTNARASRVKVRAQATRESVKALSIKFQQEKVKMTPSILDPNLFAEHAFCLTICSFGNGCATWGEKLAEGGPTGGFADNTAGGFLGLRSLGFIFDSNLLFNSRDHITWTFRNWIAMTLSFVVGFYGQLGGCNLTHEYNAAITSTMAVLLSKGMSTGVSKNLGRLQGVILGTAIGVKVYAVFGTECSWGGMGMLMLSSFLWMNFCFFLYHNSDTNSYLAFLLGYAGTMNMIGGCGQVSGLAIGNIVMDLLMTIVIMASFDLIFQKDTAANMAHKQFTKAWNMTKKSLNKLTDPTHPTIDFGGGALLAELSKAEMLGGLAEAEARWHRTPWRVRTFRDACASAVRIRYILTGMKCAAAGGSVQCDKPETLLALENTEGWDAVASRPIQKMDQVDKLLVILRHEVQGPHGAYMQAENEVKDGSKSRIFPSLVAKVAANANSNRVLMEANRGESESLETNPAARQSYLLGALAALLNEVRSLESQIIFEG